MYEIIPDLNYKYSNINFLTVFVGYISYYGDIMFIVCVRDVYACKYQVRKYDV